MTSPRDCRSRSLWTVLRISRDRRSARCSPSASRGTTSRDPTLRGRSGSLSASLAVSPFVLLPSPHVSLEGPGHPPFECPRSARYAICHLPRP